MKVDIKDVIEALHSITLLPVEDIKPDTRVVNDLALDSLDVIELATTLEIKFSLKRIPAESMETLCDNNLTVTQLTDWVAKKVQDANTN